VTPRAVSLRRLKDAAAALEAIHDEPAPVDLDR
jgi:hypothetical protein